MQETLKNILEIQELDIKMIRLMRVKKQRQRELKQIEDLREELRVQQKEKEQEVESLGKEITSMEESVDTLNARLKELDAKQSTIKKVDEFNALTKEMSSAERERIALEQQISNLVDKRVAEEEILEKIKESLEASAANSKELEAEIKSSIETINEEGSKLKVERDAVATGADKTTLSVYERLLKNKKNRVIVPIENRTCSGCHIALTAQHENLVRKGKALVFCEHCSRIHYWEEDTAPQEGAEEAPKRRRRRTVAK